MFKKWFLLLFVCFFFLNFLLWSEEEGKQLFGKKIRKIKFSGLVHVSEIRAVNLIKSFYGQKLDPVLPDAIQRRLEISGLFSEVQIYVETIAEKSVILLASVKENSMIKSITVEGANRVNILTDLSLKQGNPFNIIELSEIKAQVREKYLNKGYTDVKVSITHTKSEDGGIDILITVTEGKIEIVGEIFFEGIDKLIATADGKNHQRGLLKSLNQDRRGFTKKGFFNESKLSLDRDAIARYYASYGFLDAKVIDVRIERSIDKKENVLNVKITYIVQEGDFWSYGGISINGNKVFDTEVLLGFFYKIKIGDPVNQSLIDRAYIEGLQALYSNDGYLYNNYQMNQNRNNELKEVSFVIEINEFDRVYIGDVYITGNTKTKNHVILREILVKKGDVFSRENVLQSLRNLMTTGYFGNVTPEVIPGSIPGLVGITFNVEEGKTVGISFGLSIGGGSGSFPVAGFLQLADTNFLGFGHNLQVRGTSNQDKAELRVSFYEPRLANTRWGLGGGLKYDFNRALSPQDILFPIFEIEDIADPYTGGYIYSSGERAGQYFIDPNSNRTVPTQSEIRTLELIQDFKHYASDSAFSMTYYSQQIVADISTGYVLPIFYRFLKFEAGFQTGFDYIFYNYENYRPSYKEVRAGLNRWVFNDGALFKVSWEARDNPGLPTSGFILSQRFFLAGGILGGRRTYLQSQTRFDYHYPFPQIKFNQNSNDQNVWTMNWHFKFHTAFVWLGEQFHLPLRDTQSSHSRLDGMFIGPGWSDYNSPDGRLLWENRVQFSLDIFRQIFYWDTFFDAIFLWPDESTIKNVETWSQHFYASFGTGFRIGIPTFPMGIYLVKRFRVNEYGHPQRINWNPTRFATLQSLGLDISIVFSIDMY